LVFDCTLNIYILILILLQREDRERARADQERAAAFDRAQQERRMEFDREQREAARLEREQLAAQDREERLRRDLLELAEQRVHAAALETQLEVLRAAASSVYTAL